MQNHGKGLRPGFVVNVYDPLSFDIDLPLTPQEIKNLPPGIQSSKYLYKDLNAPDAPNEMNSSAGKNEMNSSAGKNGTDVIYSGRTFRFRLSGIIFRKTSDGRRLSDVNDLHRYTWSLIHSCDNWVMINILGIDTYNRFLGNIILPRSEFLDSGSRKELDLGRHLEEKFPEIVQRYTQRPKS